MAWGSHSEKEMIKGKVILEISRKNDVHNNYETDYRNVTANSSDVKAIKIGFGLKCMFLKLDIHLFN